MKRSDAKRESTQSRREFLLRAGATATGVVVAPGLLAEKLGAASQPRGALRIGTIARAIAPGGCQNVVRAGCVAIPAFNS